MAAAIRRHGFATILSGTTSDVQVLRNGKILCRGALTGLVQERDVLEIRQADITA